MNTRTKVPNGLVYAWALNLSLFMAVAFMLALCHQKYRLDSAYEKLAISQNEQIIYHNFKANNPEIVWLSALIGSREMIPFSNQEQLEYQTLMKKYEKSVEILKSSRSPQVRKIGAILEAEYKRNAQTIIPLEINKQVKNSSTFEKIEEQRKLIANFNHNLKAMEEKTKFKELVYEKK